MSKLMYAIGAVGMGAAFYLGAEAPLWGAVLIAVAIYNLSLTMILIDRPWGNSN